MFDRGLSGRDAYRQIASELGKRGAKVKAAKAKKAAFPKVQQKPVKELPKKPVQGELPFNYTERVNYILKDLLF